MVARRLPQAFGSAWIYVSPESQLRYLLPGAGALSLELLGWAERYVRPGDVVWDVGANSGVFAFAAAGRGGRVLAVEPDPFLANGLLRSRAANAGLSVEVLTAAVSDRLGLAVLEISSGGRAANSLAQCAGATVSFGQSVGSVTVPTVTLDSMLERGRPQFVKIDIEGAELLAVQGAERLLSEVRPTIVVEVGRERTEAVSAIFRRHGYRLFDAADVGREVPLAVFNTLAVPPA